jgi:mannan endo-1,4-beta-mannosidase
MERRGFLGAVGVAGVAGLGSSTIRAEPRRSILGIYPSDDGSPSQQTAPIERWLGTSVDVVVLYVNADAEVSVREWFIEEMTRTWQAGQIPMVTWLPYIGDEQTTPTTITRRIRDGEYDDIIDWWADALSTWLRAEDQIMGSRRCYFRPFPEMNGDWLPWSVLEDGDERAFIDAWRHVHGVLMDEIALSERIQWLWNPNATEHGEVPTEACYPGDDYVDWIGIDGYNWGDSRRSSNWQSPTAVFEEMRSRLATLTNKPLAVPEFGTTSRKNGEWDVAAKGAWITAVFAYFEANDVRMHCWFNTDKETDWAVFGGKRGTGRYEEDGKRYAIYNEFRDGVIEGHSTHDSVEPGVLPTDVFHGRFQD